MLSHVLPSPGSAQAQPARCPSAPSQTPGVGWGNSSSQVMVGLWVNLPEQVDFQPTLPT